VRGRILGQGLADVGSLRPLENAKPNIVYLKRLEMSVAQVRQKGWGGVMDWETHGANV